MDFLFTSVFAHPGFYIGAALAGVGAVGFVVCVANVLGGIVPAWKDSGHAEHLEHQRMHAVWGLYLMIWAFLAWQVVRSISSWFGYGDANPYVALWILGIAF